MKLCDILYHVQAKAEILPNDPDITAVTTDLQRVDPATLFVCIKGERFDGHALAAKAIQNGAAGVVCETPLGLPRELLTLDSREAYARICANLAGRPAERIKLAAVTGTNGKTTVASMLKAILTGYGYRCGLIGTIENEIGEHRFPTGFTTPDPAELHPLLGRMAQADCKYAVLEASSQALAQKRLAGIRFAVGVFTNLTPEHLDYHKDMESYYQAKKLLFSACEAAVINLDDPSGERLASELQIPVTLFSINAPGAQLSALDIKAAAQKTLFTLSAYGETIPCRLNLPGDYNVSNALAAVAAASLLGIRPTRAGALLSQYQGVRGRTEVVAEHNGITVVRDYAHTPDSLEKVITALRATTSGRIITLFGCGGDRDSTKRPLMGRLAAALSDWAIITSDNPRGEDPQRIIADIVKGIDKTSLNYTIIKDRRGAIEYGLRICGQGDLLLLAGKGHEEYQITGGEKTRFDEREIVGQILSAM